MWRLQKTVTISSSHHLNNYEGVCKNIHGHNWRINVQCEGNKLNETGMLVDFNDIKAAIKKFDHADLNTLLDCNPTAENIAKRIYELIPHCVVVAVEETDGSVVSYYEG